jgi:DNA-directed RNA polymerase specialized sigma24 family protein
MDEINNFYVDGNELIADLKNNKYFIIFENYEGKKIKSEIPRDIFNTYIESKKTYKKNQNEEERHWERLNLSENEIYKRNYTQQEETETIIIRNETKKELHIAITTLPIHQKRRVIQYYFKDANEYEIATREGITQKNVSESLTKAKFNLFKKLKKF